MAQSPAAVRFTSTPLSSTCTTSARWPPRSGFDTSTIGGVIDRLEARKRVRRNASSTDRHVRLLTLSQAGRALLDATVPSILRAQEHMLEPLPTPERAEFMRMLRTLVTANNELSRAPSDVG